MAAMRSATAREGARSERARVRWSRLIVDLAAAVPTGSRAVAEVAVTAARPILGADAAALVRWQDGCAGVLAECGDIGSILLSRPPEGASRAGGCQLAAVSVDPRTDLVVARDAPIGFESSDLESLHALADLIGWAGSDRAPDTALRRFAARVVTSLEPDEVLVAVADAVSHLLHAEIAGVLLRDASGAAIEMRCAIGNTKLDTGRLRIKIGQGLAGRVFASGRPERIDDYSTDPRSAPEFMALSDVEGTCAAIATPLRWDGEAIGVLCAWRRRRAAFTDADESLFAAVAELSAGAIHNAGAHQELRGRLERSEQARWAAQARHEAAEQTLHVYSELTRIAMEGEDVGAVVRAVSELIGCRAALVTDEGRLLAAAGRGAADPRGAQLAAQVVAAVPRGDAGSPLLLTRVRTAGITFGHLALCLDAPPTDADTLAAEQAAVVCALLLARAEAAVAANRRVQSEFVWDLLDGRLPDAAQAVVRARHLGLGFALPARVVAIQIDGLADPSTSRGWNPELLERTRAACGRLIAQRLDAAGFGGTVLARRADVFAAVVPDGRGDGLAGTRRLAATLSGIRWPDGLGAAVGVGGNVERMIGFPDGWREAQLARSAVGPDGEPGVFEDLGVLQFLLAPTSRADLDEFAHRQLGPLIEYDAEHGSVLLATLSAHLDAGCSTRRTAALLCIHHRTVSYRIQRMTDLTGLRLDDQEDRFRIQLACKILALGGRAEHIRDGQRIRQMSSADVKPAAAAVSTVEGTH
ncbi:helix-turn-helix domain-containing protein [Pseudonocardia sp. GCM10023141]|uniref:helix-turn-helix domain-containing protein n=1 Tax=Pseudonocardia sp. GCM10023141 TaxID=3252653 RepID=UPI00360EF8DE